MSPKRWGQLQSLFADAVELSVEDRDELLGRLASENPELEVELRSLLAHHEEELPLPQLEAPLRQVGPYRVLEEIGQGGMGTVFLAERSDGEYRGRVALKIVRRDLAGERSHHRFRRERQLLADLRHPHIASLLDAGTTREGEAWLAMDYVDGLPIDRFCTQNELSLEARLELLRTVCGAVHTAHQNLVVHRDLKPSNILVRAEGAPVLLDFGIAKLLDDDEALDGELTQLGASPRTPAYASPEQVDERPVTTATDVYALGTILYEMLTGVRPFDGSGRELERQILEDEVMLPSRRLATATESPLPFQAHRLRGDLDAIALRALSKDPAQRYGSAAELAEDLGSFLRGMPIRARHAHVTYRTFKWIQRNRWAVAAGLAITGLLVAFVTTRLVQSARLAVEAEKVQAMNTFLQETLSSSDPYEGMGKDTTVVEAVVAAASRIDEVFAAQPELAVTARQSIGNLLVNHGRYWEAEPLLTTALEERRRLTPESGAEVAAIASDLGQLMIFLGRNDEAELLIEEALGGLEGAVEDFDSHTESLSQRAWLSQYRGDFDAARSQYSEVLEMRRRELGLEDPAVATTLADLADLALEEGDLEQAEVLFREALDLLRSALGPEHPAVAHGLVRIANLTREQGDLDRAEQLYHEALSLERKALGERHPEIASTLDRLGSLEVSRGDYVAALDLLEQALELRRETLGDEHPLVGVSLDHFGTTLAEQGDLVRAKEVLQEAIRVFEASVGDSHLETAKSYNNMGVVLGKNGEHRDSLAYQEKALAIIIERLGEAHPQVAVSLNNVAAARFYLGEPRRGAEALREVLEIERKIYGTDHEDVATSLLNLGAVLTELGEYSEAEGLLLESLATFRKIQGPKSARVATALKWLAGLYDDIERYGEARDLYRQAIEIKRDRLGPEHPEVAILLNNLAMVERDQGAIADAEALFREVEDIWAANPAYMGTDVVALYKNLADLVCGIEGREVEGLELFATGLELAEGRVEAGHWLLAVFDSARGACLARLGRLAEAEPLLRTSVTTLGEVFGPDHRLTREAEERLETSVAAR